MSEELLTTQELAAALKVSTKTIYRYTEDGDLKPHLMEPRRYLLSESIAQLKERKPKPAHR